MRAMTGAGLAMAGVVLGVALGAFAAAPMQSTPLLTSTTTWSGQPLALPQGPVEVRAAHVVMPVGTALTPHQHPYPRYVYIESGLLSVSNEVTGVTREFGPGSFVVEVTSGVLCIGAAANTPTATPNITPAAANPAPVLALML